MNLYTGNKYWVRVMDYSCFGDSIILVLRSNKGNGHNNNNSNKYNCCVNMYIIVFLIRHNKPINDDLIDNPFLVSLLFYKWLTLHKGSASYLINIMLCTSFEHDADIVIPDSVTVNCMLLRPLKTPHDVDVNTIFMTTVKMWELW